MTRARKAPPLLSALLSGYVCVCQRCGARWVKTCGCSDYAEGEIIHRRETVVIHDPGCEPPKRCARCKAVGWERPAGAVGRPPKAKPAA